MHRVLLAALVRVGDRVRLQVDPEHRRGARAHHSATHLLHSALRRILGDHVSQVGSLVERNRLRFDFGYGSRVSDEQLGEIQNLVNRWILDNIPSEVRLLSFRQAIDEGALALFTDKYGVEVRVVRFGDVSAELCGGTHVRSTGEIGLVIVTSGSSIARGVRRIEALAGSAAQSFALNEVSLVNKISRELATSRSQLFEAIQKLCKKPRKRTMSGERADLDALRDKLGKLADGTPYLATIVQTDDLRADALAFAEELTGIVCLMKQAQGRLKIAIAVHEPLTGKYVARAILQSVARLVDGRGGGTDHLAEGGGAKLEAADAVAKSFANLVANP